MLLLDEIYRAQNRDVCSVKVGLDFQLLLFYFFSAQVFSFLMHEFVLHLVSYGVKRLLVLNQKSHEVFPLDFVQHAFCAVAGQCLGVILGLAEHVLIRDQAAMPIYLLGIALRVVVDFRQLGLEHVQLDSGLKREKASCEPFV